MQLRASGVASARHALSSREHLLLAMDRKTEHFDKETPWENVAAMIRCWQEMGDYPIVEGTGC